MSRSVSIVPELRGSLSAPASGHPVGAALAAVTAFARSGLRAWRMHRDLRLVASLDDRALADIGIGRGQLEGAVLFGRTGPAAADRSWQPALDPAAGPVGGTEWR